MALPGWLREPVWPFWTATLIGAWSSRLGADDRSGIVGVPEHKAATARTTEMGTSGAGFASLGYSKCFEVILYW
jgi:hypothetical protein